MADIIKFYCFVEDLANGKHNLGSNVLKIALTNTAPTKETDTVFDSVLLHPPPAAANGYTSGGYTVTVDSSTQTDGVYTLACTTDIVVTATAGGIGPFRYAILYNYTSEDKLLIGYYDNGSSVTLSAGETFDIDVTDSILTLE